MTIVLLLLAALISGVANALAGGGTFITFPALLFAGIASVKANATACLVMVPGGIASTWVYRAHAGGTAARAGVATGGGEPGWVGRGQLAVAAYREYDILVTRAVAAAGGLGCVQCGALAAPDCRQNRRQPVDVPLLLAGQCCIALYGGYFGAGMGVLMIALFLAVSSMDVQSASGVRLVCATSVNLLAVVIFALKGAIVWNPGVPMLLAGIAGGYLGARVMRRLSEKAVRTAILVYAWGLTVYFFIAR